MNRKYISARKTLIFLLIAVAIILMLPAIFSFNQSFAWADSELGGTLTTTIFDSNFEDVSPTGTASYSNSTIYSYEWEKSNKIQLKYTKDGDISPNASGKYNVTLSVEFLKGYINSTFTQNETKTKEIVNQIYDTVPNTLTYGFDINNNDSETKIQGWGIYRFKITINNAEKYSSFIFISPQTNLAEDKRPTITYEIIPSVNSLRDSFKFSIENIEDYKYVDTEKLIWHVDGESIDGKKYVLTKQDFENQEENIYEAYIYSDITRTGTSFIFNDNGIEGTWNVWCEFAGSDSITLTSTKSEVQTSANPKLFWVIGVVVGASALAVGGVVFFAYRRSKKEKVW